MQKSRINTVKIAPNYKVLQAPTDHQHQQATDTCGIRSRTLQQVLGDPFAHGPQPPQLDANVSNYKKNKNPNGLALQAPTNHQQ